MCDPDSLPIILLAAGQSSRMAGRDKLMEIVDGMPLLRRQARVARAATKGDVLVTLPPPPHPRYGALEGLDVTPLPVALAHLGQSESLKTGLNAVPQGARAAMILLADLPDLTARDLIAVRRSVDFSNETLVWRGATQKGAPGHPVIVAASLFAELCGTEGDTGGQDVLRAYVDKTNYVRLAGNRALADLDTPQDWANWRAKRDK